MERKLNYTIVKGNRGYRTVFLLIASLFFSCVLLSCENFLNGDQFLQTIEKEIKYANAPFVSVQMFSDPDARYNMIPAEGVYGKVYKAGDKIELEFVPKNNYRFIKWECTPADAVEFKIAGNAKTIATICKDDNPIKIQAVCSDKIRVNLSFKYAHGSTVPSESKILYSNEELSVSYREETDYAFTGWKVYEKNGVDLSSYISFDASKKEITFTTNNLEDLSDDLNVVLEAESVKRPKVVSNTPLYDSNGVYRDRRLIVMFDHQMDESSIYWTMDELNEMGVTSEAGYEFLEAKKKIGEDATGTPVYKNLKNPDEKQYYYAYQQKGNAESRLFKNISICNRIKNTMNYLQFYDMPYFDEEDKSVLRIDASTTNPPPAVTDILVTVAPDICFKENNIDIKLSSEYSWAYYTNGKVDKDAPIIDESFKLLLADDIGEGQTTLGASDDLSAINDTSFAKTNDVSNDKKTHIKYNTKNKKLWLKGTFSDSGSGPAGLKWKLYKVNSDYYPIDGDLFVNEGKVDDLSIVGSNADIASEIKVLINAEEQPVTKIDIGDNLSEGIYRIDFVATDKNERASTPKSFYFVHDTTPPELIDVNTVSNVRKSTEKETVLWGDSISSDYDHAVVERIAADTVETDNGEEYTATVDEKEHMFTGLERRIKYEYRLYSVDWYGNKSESYTQWKDEKVPDSASLINRSTISHTRDIVTQETINFSIPTAEETEYYILRQYNPNGSLKEESEISKNETNKIFTGMSEGQYIYRFYAVDYSNNISTNYTEWKDEKAPVISNVYSSGKKNSKVHLYFDTPSEIDFSHVEVWKNNVKQSFSVKKLDGNSSSESSVNQKNKHYEIELSDAGKADNYVIKTYDYAKNISEVRLQEGYAQPGMICHDNTAKNEVFVSLNVYKNQNPVGVLYTVDEYINTWGNSGRKANLVYDMKEYTDYYFWGQDNGDPKNGDGKKFNGWDDYVNFTDSVNHSNLYNKTVNCHSAYNKKDQTSYTIWYELYFNVNKQSTDKNNKVIWYVPAIDQFDTIISKRDSIDVGFNKLREAGYTPVLQTAGKRLGSSSTTNDGDCYYVLNASAIPNKRFGIVREDRDNVGTSYWHCIAEINLD